MKTNNVQRFIMFKLKIKYDKNIGSNKCCRQLFYPKALAKKLLTLRELLGKHCFPELNVYTNIYFVKE